MKDFFLRIEKMAGFDFGYFFNNGFWVSFRYGVIGISGLLLSVAFARLADKELLGQYQYVLSIAALLSIVSLPGLNLVALRDVVRGKNESVYKAVRESFFWSLSAIPVIFAYAAYHGLSGNIGMGYAFFILGVFFPFFYAPNTWYVFYEGQSRFKPVTVRMVFLNICVSIALIIELLFGTSLFSIIATYFGLSALFNFAFFREIIRHIRPKADDCDPIDRKYGISCTIQKFSLTLVDVMPPIVIAHLFGYAAVATYQIAYYPVAFVLGFVGALSAIYLPHLFRGFGADHRIRFMFIQMIVGISLSLILFLVISVVFIPLYGEAYQSGFSLALIFSGIAAMFPLRVMLVNILTTEEKNGLVTKSAVMASVAAAVLAIFSSGFGFFSCILIYIYSLNIFLILLLLRFYFLSPRRSDSMRSVQV